MNKRFITVLSLLLISLVLTGCTEVKYQESGQTSSGKPVEEKEVETLKILEHKMIEDFNDFFTTVTVEGIAQNVGSKQLSYAEVRVKFLDKDGILVDTSLDNTNDLDAGEKWKFKVMYLGTDENSIYDYKIAVGTGLEAF